MDADSLPRLEFAMVAAAVFVFHAHVLFNIAADMPPQVYGAQQHSSGWSTPPVVGCC